ncbi:ArnT family glycosyltransferase [Hoeflea poritis]|uniref:Glycosyltransferase family 39 protein n=1 Tax=Hoeflea poritis TaxID=2993659 RepID=A0ABT4VSL4_9HYPH|nr:glycosyltransferase family 39 protein [Hoeflea poritis]MDA4847690.1 glycosyltransferase family 39 protein [Hoeflea poritis]
MTQQNRFIRLGAADGRAGLLRYVMLFFLGLAVLVPGIGQLPPIDRDEARYVQSTKQMVESGDYVDIRFQNQPRYKKPIGVYWLQSLTVSLTGEGGEAPIAAYRIVSVIAVAASVAALYWVGQALFGHTAGLIAALMLAGMFGAGFEGRLAKTDSVLLLLTIVAQGCLARTYVANREDKEVPGQLVWLFWIAQGASILVKGPITPLVSALTVLFIVIFDRGRSRAWLSDLKPLRGLALAVLIALPWLLLITWKSGAAFWQEAIGRDMLAKVASGQESHGAPPGYYILTYSLLMWPFGLIAVIGGTHALRRMFADARMMFCVAWYLPLWLFFELIPTKLPHYVLPSYPAILLLGGWFLGLAASEAPKPLMWQRILHGLTGFGVIVVTIAFASLAIIVPVYIAGSFSFWSIPVVLLLVMACWFSLGYGLELAPVRRVLVATLTATTAYGLAFSAILPQVDEMWVSRQIVERFEAEKACADSVLASVTYHEPSLVFLAGTETLLTGPGSAAEYLLSDPDCAIAAVPEEDAPAFLTALSAGGARAEGGEPISGFNYSKGRRLSITLYRITGQ